MTKTKSKLTSNRYTQVDDYTSDGLGGASDGTSPGSNPIHQTIIHHPYISKFHLLFWVGRSEYPSDEGEIVIPIPVRYSTSTKICLIC